MKVYQKPEMTVSSLVSDEKIASVIPLYDETGKTEVEMSSVFGDFEIWD